jgi:protein disulfide-isomerase A1
MNRQNLPAVSPLTAENFSSFSTSDKVVIVSFASEGSAAQKAFNDIANKFRDDYLFGSVSDSELASQEGATLDGTIVLYKTFDEGKNVYEHKDIDSEDLSNWIKANSFPLFDQISPENFSKYAQAGLPIGYLFIDPEDPKKESIIAELKPVAEKFKGKISFCWIDAVKVSCFLFNSLGLRSLTLDRFVSLLITANPSTCSLENSHLLLFKI